MFTHAPFYVQRAELDRARRESPRWPAGSASRAPLDCLIGDAAYTPREYTGPADQKLPPGQAADRPSWETSIGRVRSMAPSRLAGTGSLRQILDELGELQRLGVAPSCSTPTTAIRRRPASPT